MFLPHACRVAGCLAAAFCAGAACPCFPMHHTIFDTPVVNTLLRAFSRATLRLTGWKVEGASGK